MGIMFQIVLPMISSASWPNIRVAAEFQAVISP